MGGLLGGGGSGGPPRYAGMQVSQSTQGQVIPYITGRTRVPMNLIWYGNFQSTGTKAGKSGGGGPSSYTYSAAWIAALGLGPITGVFTVWHDKSIMSLTLENLGLALGSTGQSVWSGYPSGTPAQQQIPYSGIAYVATNLYQFGDSPSMPNLNFEVEGVVGGYSDVSGMLDSDPAAVIPDYLQSTVHGAGFQGTIFFATLIGTTNTYQAYVQSLGLLVSLNENTQRASSDCMKELMQITNSDFVLSCGILKVIPYADVAVSATTADGTSWSYTPSLAPVFSFTDSDYCPKKGDEPVKLKRKALKDTYNVINVEVLDRSNAYNPTVVTASDNWDISLSGPRVMATVTLHQVTSVAVGKMVAQLILQQQLYDRNSWEWRVRADYCLLEPMDYVACSDSKVGLVQKLMRISKVEDDADNYFTITAMEVTGTTRNAPVYNWTANAGYAANFDAAPGSVSPPAIFQMPALPASLNEGPDGIILGIAVCGPTSAAFWGGCEVYCSIDGGTTYEWVGTVRTTGPARYGVTTGAITAVPDPDTTTTLPVALVNTTLQLSTAVTHAEADSNQTLILVGSGALAEVMSYGAGSLISAGNYNLSYLRRNLYGSSNSAHASGVQFVRLDGSIFQLPIDPGAAGQTLFFKFTSFNVVGRAVEALAGVTAYSYAVPLANPVGGIATLIPRGSCAISGATVYTATTKGNAWDSDVHSTAAYSSVSVSAQYSAGGALGIGLSTTIGTISMDLGSGAVPGFYGFYAHSDAGQTVVIDNSGNALTLPTPAYNDLYQVTYDGFTVRWYLNGVLVWSAQHQGLQVYVYATFFEPGCVFSNVETTVGALATPSQFIATGNCVVNDTNAMKQGGSTAWDSCVYSVVGYLTCHITAKVNAAATSAMVGLSTSPTSSSNFTNANYALYANDSGQWQVYESGTPTGGGLGASSVSDAVWISYDGSNVKYYINDPTTAVHTTAVAGLTLYGFCPIEAAGQGLNSLRFGPTTNLALKDRSQLGVNSASLLVANSSVSTQQIICPVSGAVQDLDAISATVVCDGSTLGIDVSAMGEITRSSSASLSSGLITVRRDGSDIGTTSFDCANALSVTGSLWAGQVTLAVVDTPSAGSHTYTMHLHGVGAGPSGAATINAINPIIKVREYYK